MSRTESFYYQNVVPGQHSTGTAPTITSVDPTFGDAGGDVALTINGTGFVAGVSVGFGGFIPTSVIRVSATKITCVTPATPAGDVLVYVVNPDGLASNGVVYRAVRDRMRGNASIVFSQSGNLTSA